ncbi:hypothetical protein FQN55_002557 [Onygenales sp. PD_40]|nr:hypothetical protein FQN55_002557 [Onygenales sp. PD_40]KAK2784454.1 hypothetical protein FQN52_009035 [Onygenales sp. PD_12]KAK2786562.1 hypothetical protein FQN53_006497 [Emmonsiellopsis sp. PD_33]KAK2798158.1 hypothetical protein FQN51_007844 [Onygenales sp. PD_10]
MANDKVADDEGASPAERVSGACRDDNPDILEEVLTEMEQAKKSNEEIAKFFNGVTDPLGNHALHICAMHGSYHAADFLFDIEFFECDPKTRIEKETPLHLAARYANDTSRYNSVRDAVTMIEMMCEAGCDPRVTNKRGETPARLPDMIPEEVRKALKQAEYLLNEGLADNNNESDEEGNSASDSE